MTQYTYAHKHYYVLGLQASLLDGEDGTAELQAMLDLHHPDKFELVAIVPRQRRLFRWLPLYINDGVRVVFRKKS